MAGVVFIICIPTEEHETNLRCKVKKRVVIQDAPVLCKSNSSDEISSSAKMNIKNQKEQRKEKQTLLSKESCAGNYEAFDSVTTKTNYDNLSMQKVMEDIIKQLKIENTTWSHSTNDKFIQIIFTLESGAVYEEVLETLKECKIGEKHKSVVSVVPCTLYYNGSVNREQNDTKLEDELEEQSKDSGWTRFMSSVSARLTVAQVVENIKTDAALTFDFICLITISTIVCGIGLVENNNVYLLSSMLISPMMGPVMAGTFGTVIRDRRLQKTGVQNELIGLGIATVVGFLYGAIICICTDRYGETDWPTAEMVSRCQIRTLGVGCLIALLSGAAVALGVLSDNIASLVGVAISTSLMPPAVNAGLLWSLAAVYYLKGDETTRYYSLTHTNYYFTDMAGELSSLAAISLCLTFVNIICIYVAGILVFKIKEVAPIASRDQARRRFWKHDIKIARDYNRTLNNDAGFEEHEEHVEKASHQSLMKLHLHHSTDLTQDNDKINIRRCQYTWSPCTYVSTRPSIQELKELYFNLYKDKSNASRYPNRAVPGRIRRLSQIFNPGESDIMRDEVLLPIPEVLKECTQTSSSNSDKKTRKFVVTPCSLDNV